MEQTLLVLNTLVFLDMLSVGLVIPLLPFLAEQLEMGPELYGLLGTFYQAAQLVGSLFMGALSDSLGNKGVLLLSFAGSALSYTILGLTNSIAMVFFSRLLVGAVKQTMSTCTSLLADLPSTNSSNLSKRIGQMRAVTSLGFIVGPLLGGQLSSWNTSIPCLLSAFIFLINSAVVLFLLSPPEHKDHNSSFDDNSGSFWKSLNGLKKSFTNPRTRRWLILGASVYFTVAIARTNLPLSNKEHFDVDVKGNGVFMAVLGGASVVTHSIGFPIISSKIHHTKGQLIIGCLILIVAFFGTTIAPNFEITLITVSSMILGSGIVSTTTTACYSQALPRGKKGSGMGVSGAVQSLMGVMAPTIAGILYQEVGTMSACFVSGSICIIILGCIALFPPTREDVGTKKFF